jgi:hypothetical protein
VKRYMVRHANGASSTSVSGLTLFTGPFDCAGQATTWAINKWGPAGDGATVTWAICPLGNPDER